ncbi:MAG TPA: FtsX-like permease family protein [Candidatus Marinimicrobia bacterium]|nr:FtsX-like permease family protein [Candidatus Neomarinimicrobiota bacterium]
MITFIIKGLLRDRHRSLFPVIMVTIGVFITILFQSFMNGVLTDMVDSIARFSSGHVKIMSRAYRENEDQLPNDLALTGVDDLIRDLKKEYPDMTWVERIKFGGLLDIPDENGETRAQGTVAGMGVDLLSPGTTEISTLNIENAVVSGRMPVEPGEILISDEMASRLEIALGDAATLLSSSMYGSMAIYNFKVVGTVKFGIPMMDRGAMIADIRGVQEALNMEDAAGEILGYLPHGAYNDEVAAGIVANFNARYADNDSEFAPVMGTLKELSNLSDYLDLANNMSSMIALIFVIIMSVVLWNAGLLGGLRRYGEVGVRLAIGEPKGHIYRSLLAESIVIGLAGFVIGTVIGLAAAYWLQTKGLDISGAMKNVNMMIPLVFRTKITPATYYIGLFPGLIATVLGTALAGIGIYKRQTASLFKELEA